MFKGRASMMIIISVAIGAMAALMTGCASTAVGGQSASNSADKTLKITIPGEPTTTDPTKEIETNAEAITSQTNEGIYRDRKSVV